MPKLVGYAVHHAVRGDRKKKSAKVFTRRLKKMGDEERERRYEVAKALNIKHGIDPHKYREQHALFNAAKKVGKYRKPVTLPKISI